MEKKGIPIHKYLHPVYLTLFDYLFSDVISPILFIPRCICLNKNFNVLFCLHLTLSVHLQGSTICVRRVRSYAYFI